MPRRTERRNLPVAPSVGSAVEWHGTCGWRARILSCNKRCWVVVPAPSIPSRTMKFFNTMIDLPFFSEINYSVEQDTMPV